VVHLSQNVIIEVKNKKEYAPQQRAG